MEPRKPSERIETRFDVDPDDNAAFMWLLDHDSGEWWALRVPTLFIRPLLATLEHAILTHPELYPETAARFVDDAEALSASRRGDPL